MLPWSELLESYLPPGVELTESQQNKSNQYLTTILRWNDRINLTAIREPAEIIQRHFGESLFAAHHLPDETTTLLDFGSGAGFPGLPIQTFRPDLKVTLAEANARKVAFLREVVRQLGLTTEVASGRVEQMPPERMFDVVTLRAVEKMPEAVPVAAKHVGPAGWLLLLITTNDAPALAQTVAGFCWQPPVPIPESEFRVLMLGQRATV